MAALRIRDRSASRTAQAFRTVLPLFAAETCDKVVDRCLQLFGSYGYMMEYPIANMYTGSRVNRIYGGTSEIMKEITSRSL